MDSASLVQDARDKRHGVAGPMLRNGGGNKLAAAPTASHAGWFLPSLTALIRVTSAQLGLLYVSDELARSPE